MSSYNPLLLGVGWASDLLLTEKYSKSNRMSLLWLGYKRLTSILLSDTLLTCCFTYLETNCRLGEAQVACGLWPAASELLWPSAQHLMSNEILPTTPEWSWEWVFPQSHLQMKPHTLGPISWMQPVRDSEEEDPTKLCPYSWLTEKMRWQMCVILSHLVLG